MEGPRPDKFAFAQQRGAMKAPVGLSSDRTVLRQQDGGASPRQVRVCAAARSNESPSGAFKRPNGLAAARWRGLAPTSAAARVRRAVNEQRQGIIVAMASCLLFCGIKFALCELGRSPIWRMGVIAAYVRTERSCTPLARCNTLDFVPKSVCQGA